MPARIEWTAARLETLRALVLAGHSEYEIGEKMKLGHGTVWRKMFELGITRRQLKRAPTAVEMTPEDEARAWRRRYGDDPLPVGVIPLTYMVDTNG